MLNHNHNAISPKIYVSEVVDTMENLINWQTGTFTVDGKEFVFPLCSSNLNYRDGWIYWEDFEGIHYGWKAKSKDEKLVKIIFNERKRSFSCSITFISYGLKIDWEQKI